jgi:hypothetical protein
VIVSYALYAKAAAMEGGKGGERFPPAHPGRDDGFAARHEKGGEAGEGGAMVPSGFAAFTGTSETKSVVSLWRAVRPALPGDRLTRREAGPKGGEGGVHRPGAAFTAFPPGRAVKRSGYAVSGGSSAGLGKAK